MTNRGLVVGSGSAGVRHLRTIEELLPTASHHHISSRDFSSWWTNLHGKSGKQLAEIDFAIIASPAPMHLEHAMALAEESIPLLIEKPLASTVDEARALQSYLDSHAAQVQVGYVLRHTPAFQHFKEKLSRFGIERISAVEIRCHSFLPDWRKSRNYKESVSAKRELGGGALLELSHELDYAVALFGPITITTADISKSPELDIDVETKAKIVGELANGSPIHFSLDIGNRHVERFCEVRFPEGSRVKWSIVDNSVSIADSGKSFFDTQSFSCNRDDWYKNQFGELLESIKKKSAPVPSIAEGVQTMELIEAIWQQALGLRWD